jgi:hypothetical protein
MLFRPSLVAASLALAAIGSASPAIAEPHCAAGDCGSAGSRTPSYQDGYSSEHSFYADPRNRNFLKNSMQQGGYDTAVVCQMEVGGGPPPPNPSDWMRGCIDALHDLGVKP